MDFQDKPGMDSPTSRRADFSAVATLRTLRRGKDFFQAVYGKVAERVMNQMDNSGTEDLGLVARLMYSHILSNTTVLNEAETSFVMIASLIPQDACGPPLLKTKPVNHFAGKPATERPLEGGIEWRGKHTRGASGERSCHKHLCKCRYDSTRR